MPYKFNPFTGTFDDVTSGGGGGGTTNPGGSTTQVQFNDGGAFGGDVDLTWNKTTNVLGIAGDVNLSDGGTYTTTLQTITPTAARTISLPDATGTVALVAGSSGQILWNNAGVNAGASTLTYDGSILTTSGRFINSYNATASSPAKAFTGTWFTGGTGTTTKPQVLIEPTGATSTAWSTSGTGLGVNAASGFTGNLLDLQVNGTSQCKINKDAFITARRYIDLDNGFALQQGNLLLNSASLISFTGDSSVGSTADLVIRRDAANTLAQRNGTNAQTFRVYNTFTDASNYQRTSFTDSSTGLVINQEFAGTGAARTNLLDLQVNGTGLARVTSGGRFLSASTIAYAATGADTTGIGFRGSVGVLYAANTAVAEFTSAEIRLLTTGLFSWGSSGAGSASDLAITRDAANTLAQRNGTNAQTFRVYGTYTDASNYVRAALSSTSTAVTLAAETAGTGADNIPLNLTAAGTGTIKVNSVAEVVVSSTVAGLPAAPVVGMLTRVTDATAPAVGVTVTGGGAAAALVWYNGTAWSVIGV